MKIYKRYVDEQSFNLWKLKDTFEEEKKALEDTIKFESEQLKIKRADWETTYDKLTSLQINYISALKIISEDEDLKKAYEGITGINVVEKAFELYKDYYNFVTTRPIPSGTKPVYEYGALPPETAKEIVEENKGVNLWKKTFGRFLGIGGRQRGDFFIPRTDLYLLHRGEKVIPAGREKTGGSINIHVEPINVYAEIKDFTSIKDLGSKIGKAIAAELVGEIKTSFEVG